MIMYLDKYTYNVDSCKCFSKHEWVVLYNIICYCDITVNVLFVFIKIRYNYVYVIVRYGWW